MPEHLGNKENDPPFGKPDKTNQRGDAKMDRAPKTPVQSVDRLLRAADRMARQINQLQDRLGEFGDSIETEGSGIDNELRESLEKVQAQLRLAAEHVEATLLPALSGSAQRLAEMIEFRRLLGCDIPRNSDQSEPT